MTEPLIWFAGHLAWTGQDRETNSLPLEGKREWKTEDKRENTSRGTKRFLKTEIENRGNML